MTTDRDPYQCPVCDRVDPDGLEACSGCYSSVIADLAKMRRERDEERSHCIHAQNERDEALEERDEARDERDALLSYLAKWQGQVAAAIAAAAGEFDELRRKMVRQ